MIKEKNNESDESSFFKKLRKIFYWTFQSILVLFLITLFLKEIYPNLISSVMSVAWLLFLIIVFGLLALLFPVKNIENFEIQATRKEYILIVLLETAVGYIIFMKLREAGFLSTLIGYFFSIIAGIAIVLIIFLLVIRWLIKKFAKKSF